MSRILEILLLVGRTTTLFLLALAVGFTFLSPMASGQSASTKELHALFDEFWEAQLKRYPTWATYLGDKRFDSLLTDLSPQARAESQQETRDYLQRLQAIDKTTLSPDDLVSAGILELRLKEAIEGEKFKNYTMPLGQQDGPHLDFPNLIAEITFQSGQDYENFHKRMLAFPKMIDQTIENMREGMALGLVSARINIEPTVPQMASFMLSEPTKTVFYEPIVKNAAKLDQETLDKFATKYVETIKNVMQPAYRKLHEFVVQEYLPKCRNEFGIWSLPDGALRYAFQVKHHTTLPLPPEVISQIGTRELAKIHAQMDKIIKQVGFEGTRFDFMKFLHTDPQFYYTNKDSLLANYDRILRNIETKARPLFGVYPKARCEVKELEEYRAADAPTAYYNGAAKDGSRPGYFYANTYLLNTRPIYEMEALTYHEAIPGHHLQGSISQELTGVPEFRKNTWFTAYGEGWALYAEQLPKEVGCYQDPYSEFGLLIYDAWRAARLVVDVGLHYKKWDRQQAIDFMAENFGGTDHNVESEVDRYIAWPGQALGYKIGQLKILELRDRAKAALGDKFTLAEFHDQVLNSGSMPLPVLEAKIDNWIAGKK